VGGDGLDSLASSPKFWFTAKLPKQPVEELGALMTYRDEPRIIHMNDAVEVFLLFYHSYE
jgi:hypothetical protein